MVNPALRMFGVLLTLHIREKYKICVFLEKNTCVAVGDRSPGVIQMNAKPVK